MFIVINTPLFYCINMAKNFLNILIINAVILHAGGISAVAIFSALNLLLRFMSALSSGVTGVGMPISGVLNEERDITSLKQLVKAMFTYSNVLLVPIILSLLIFHNYLAVLFDISGDSFLFALICFSAYIPLFININLFIAWFTALRRVGIANIITFSIDMVLLPLFAVILIKTGDFIWLHMPLAGIAAALLIVFLVYRYHCNRLISGRV